MQVSPTSPLWNTVNIVAYKLTAHALVVSWENIGQSPLDLDSLNSFQVAITDGSDPLAPDGNNVSFCYREVQWVVGNQFGLDPSPATVGTNWGNGVDFMQVGRFGFTDSVWNGQMTWSGSGWLNGRHVAFNAGPLPVPPFYSTKECDTVEVNVGDTGHYVITAHRGGPAPPMSAYSTCSSLTNYTVANQTVDGSHVLTSTFIPVEGEEGLHTMNFQAATGIGAPSTTQRYINVLGTSGVAERKAGRGLLIFPNPAQGDAWIAWNGETAQEIQLTDAQGRTVQRMRPVGTDLHISTAGLPSGLYAVRVLAGGQVAVGRLLVAAP
ncbi:MAG: T9SS type A sorting domain-containing protein [Bacteroidetes bacterium]|nr:T9SS type A sorting domain-containing protein [Bacteroidota bacterium]